MVKEFVLIERGEYNRLKDNPTSNVSSKTEIVSDTAPCRIIDAFYAQHLLSAVKNKVGIMYHNKSRTIILIFEIPSLNTDVD